MPGEDTKVLLSGGTTTMSNKKNPQCIHCRAVNVDPLEAMATGESTCERSKIRKKN
jgi:hypothetical protein